MFAIPVQMPSHHLFELLVESTSMAMIDKTQDSLIYICMMCLLSLAKYSLKLVFSCWLAEIFDCNSQLGFVLRLIVVMKEKWSLSHMYKLLENFLERSW